MTLPRFTLTVVPGRFAICRLDAAAPIPDWALVGGFVSVTRTEDELSVVCPEENVPGGVTREDGRGCLKVEGPLAFSMTGVLSSLTGPLAAAGISVFVLSTHDTDYFLLRVDDLDHAISILSEHGHTVRSTAEQR